MPQRKLARVLPDPVGAQISVFFPPEIASQPSDWAGVGPSKAPSNQRRTGSLKGASGSAGPAGWTCRQGSNGVIRGSVFGSISNPRCYGSRLTG